jgi:hypothetical protein
MDSCFVENPVQEMLSCGLVALLRTALDEREESVVFAATHCLASLIAPQVSLGRLLYILIILSFPKEETLSGVSAS